MKKSLMLNIIEGNILKIKRKENKEWSEFLVKNKGLYTEAKDLYV